jgi:2-methylisocitrate lyase-like PEP mutase family enzyme
MTDRRVALRELVSKKEGLVVPGAYDGISARLVQDAGFPAVYMTGYGTAASRLGLPDLGFAGLGEMADHARNLAAILDVPLIADADTGYGNALNVRRTVQMYEAAGVAALHIEDQITPKRCGHLSGHQVVPRSEFVGKIRAAVEARTDPNMMIIARTDAISAVDLDEALRRGEAAAKAGADVLFIEAPRTEAQVEQVARAFRTPLLYNYAPGGRSPLCHSRGFASSGSPSSCSRSTPCSSRSRRSACFSPRRRRATTSARWPTATCRSATSTS